MFSCWCTSQDWRTIYIIIFILTSSQYYHEGRIRCPWHGACFSTKTGDIEDYPCVDAIHAYNVIPNPIHT